MVPKGRKASSKSSSSTCDTQARLTLGDSETRSDVKFAGSGGKRTGTLKPNMNSGAPGHEIRNHDRSFKP